MHAATAGNLSPHKEAPPAPMSHYHNLACTRPQHQLAPLVKDDRQLAGGQAGRQVGGQHSLKTTAKEWSSKGSGGTPTITNLPLVRSRGM